jgi:predicted dehydrogenase
MLTRRALIKKSLLSAAATGFPAIIPGTALGLNGRPAASERITMAAFGFGTIAYTTVPAFLQDERVQIVAIADPVSELGNYGYSAEKTGGRLVGKALIEKHYAEAKDGTFKGCTAYEDFRQLLEKEDIDAVNVSSPDHWHAYMAIYCARKGKHIYGQKPLALTVGEGRRMVEEVKKSGITWQTGSQQRSDLKFRMAAGYVRNGRLGKISEIRVGLPAGHTNWSKLADRQASEAPPKELNWDLWLGPAPQQDYAPAILQLNWRHNYAYSGGMITDWGAHHMDIVQWALDMDQSGPVAMENIKGEMPAKDALYNTATAFHFEAIYASGTRMIVDSSFREGIEFIGENGKKIFVKRDLIEFTPQELRAEQIKPEEIQLHLSKKYNHNLDFIDHIYDGAATAAPIEASHRTISIAHLANLGLRSGISTMKWDSTIEQSSDAAINAQLTRPMRAPYDI